MHAPSIFLAACLTLGPAAGARADEPTQPTAQLEVAAPAANAIHVSVVGALGYTQRNIGDFALGYERRLADSPHGLVAEATFIHVMAGLPSNHELLDHMTLLGARLGYRYHLSRESTHAFVGALAGFRMGSGWAQHYHGDDKRREGYYQIRGGSLTAHLGHRLQLTESLAITTRLGIGYEAYRLTAKKTDDPAAPNSIAAGKAVLSKTPVAVDSELSLTYVF